MRKVPRIILVIILLTTLRFGSMGQDSSAIKQWCNDTHGIVSKLNALINKPVFSSARAALLKAGADKNEHGLMFGKDAADEVIVSPVITGGSKNSSPVNIGFPGAFADMHNHPGNTAPSAGDIYNLIKLNKDHPAFNTRFAVLASGVTYAIVITDTQKAGSFIKKYPSEQTPGFSPRFPEKQFNEFADLKSYLINIQGIDKGTADEIATVYMLDRYDTGLAVFRFIETKGFSRIIIKETTGFKGNKLLQTNFCPD
jgi:hypothetical protein